LFILTIAVIINLFEIK